MDGEDGIPPDLYKLITSAHEEDERRWHLVSSLVLSRPALAAYRHPAGRCWTPLHAACDASAPPHVVDVLVRSDPAAASVRDAYGATPLHIRFWSALGDERIVLGDDEEAAVVRILLDAYPGATMVTDESDSTPLHLSVLMGAPIEVVRELCRTAAAAEGGIGGGGGDTRPTAVAATAMQNYRGNTPLHDCIAASAPRLTLQELLTKSDPSVLSTQNELGNTPLHLACDVEAPNPDTVYMVRMILLRCCCGGTTDADAAADAGGECLRLRNEDGRTPLSLLCWKHGDDIRQVVEQMNTHGCVRNSQYQHIPWYVWPIGSDLLRCMAFGTVNEPDGTDGSPPRYLAHAVLRTDLGVPVDFQMLTFRVLRHELLLPDGRGNLPLHYACGPNSRLGLSLPAFASASTPTASHRHRPFDPALDLLQLLPAAARVSNGEGMLPLHIMARAGRTWRRGGVRDMVRAYPGAVLGLDDLDFGIFPLILSRFTLEGNSEEGIGNGLALGSTLGYCF